MIGNMFFRKNKIVKMEGLSLGVLPGNDRIGKVVIMEIDSKGKKLRIAVKAEDFHHVIEGVSIAAAELEMNKSDAPEVMYR